MVNQEEEEYKDCPEQLIKLAKSPFEKACVVEFVEVEGKMREEFIKLRKDTAWCKWLLTTVLIVIVVNIGLGLI